ncbi:MAG: 2-oxoacid:acceptor oxidoreductase family protein, partial [Deltaproteobacteria bacterium]
LKVGDFSSPLIRPAKADGLLALKKGGLDLHGVYLKPNSWMVVNTGHHVAASGKSAFIVDADRIAQEIDHPRSVNLIVLGFALAVAGKNVDPRIFCSLQDILAVLENRMGDKREVLSASLVAIETGYNAGLMKVPNNKSQKTNKSQ